MPELPDVVVYLEALRRCVVGQRLTRINLLSPFVLRSFDPPVDSIVGQVVRDVRRIGKRLVFEFPGDRRVESGSEPLKAGLAEPRISLMT